MHARKFPARSLLLGSIVGLAAALVLGVGAAGAKTVNLVPNPGFETGPCGFDGPIICDWNELNVAPMADGAWHQVSGTLTAPPGTGSAFFFVDESCESCTATLAVNFDDLFISNHRR